MPTFNSPATIKRISKLLEHSVHAELAQTDPAALAKLFSDLMQDRQREHEVWTPEKREKLGKAYKYGGMAAARSAFPNCRDSQLQAQIRKLGVKRGHDARTRGVLFSNAPRSVFDLGY